MAPRTSPWVTIKLMAMAPTVTACMPVGNSALRATEAFAQISLAPLHLLLQNLSYWHPEPHMWVSYAWSKMVIAPGSFSQSHWKLARGNKVVLLRWRGVIYNRKKEERWGYCVGDQHNSYEAVRDITEEMLFKVGVFTFFNSRTIIVMYINGCLRPPSPINIFIVLHAIMTGEWGKCLC